MPWSLFSKINEDSLLVLFVEEVPFQTNLLREMVMENTNVIVEHSYMQ
jgi:hypothetical protein